MKAQGGDLTVSLGWWPNRREGIGTVSLSVRALYPNPGIVSQDLEGLCINSAPRVTEA